MNAQLTLFDMQFLSDCGVTVDESAPAKESDRVKADNPDGQEMDAAAIYYRRIVEELG